MKLTRAGNGLVKRLLVLKKAAKQAPILQAAAAGVMAIDRNLEAENYVV